MTSPREILGRKRNGEALPDAEVDAFVRGLVDGSWSDAQAGAMAMAVFLNGMTRDETVALTSAMTSSGEVLDWRGAGLPGPVLDKHSTGGVGDKVSLVLAPIVAACGGCVPMISGRGLGHTGGTLDKLDTIPGYRTSASVAQLREVVLAAGCAIVGQSAELAPADRRLYAMRHATNTVESIPLITASILSKKLAAGLQGLVLDVKTGNGAFAAERTMAMALARSLVDVANGAGLPTRAWITDMSQVLGTTAGNALEVREAIGFLDGTRCEPRLLQVTRVLAAELLQLGGIARNHETACAMVDSVLADGRALDRFARMVSASGGPADFVEHHARYLAAAPVQRAVTAREGGWLVSVATRDLGLLVMELGGGRRQEGDTIDASVGLEVLVRVGERVEPGQVLAMVHARDAAGAKLAEARLRAALEVADAPLEVQPPLMESVGTPAGGLSSGAGASRSVHVALK